MLIQKQNTEPADYDFTMVKKYTHAIRNDNRDLASSIRMFVIKCFEISIYVRMRTEAIVHRALLQI